MPTNKPRVTITMSEEQYNLIEEYRFNKKFKNQTQAILSLIEAGISNLTGTESFSPYDSSSIKLIEKYKKLDRHGQDMVETVLNKEYERIQTKEKINHLEPIAAHNDNTNKQQLQLMAEDLDEL
jgi:hypothetical protein